MKKLKEKGQGMVEYSITIIMIAIATIGAIRLVGPMINGVFSDIITAMQLN
jgi:Flp pilus assembly pilin Flp